MPSEGASRGNVGRASSPRPEPVTSSITVTLGSAIGRDLYWASAGHLLALGLVRWAEGVRKHSLGDLAVPLWVRSVVRPEDVEAEHAALQAVWAGESAGAAVSGPPHAWAVAPTGGVFVDVDLSALGVSSSELAAASKAIAKRAAKEARALGRNVSDVSSPGRLRRLSLPLRDAVELFGDTDPAIAYLSSLRSPVCDAVSLGGLVLPSECVPGSARASDASALQGPVEVLGVSEVALHLAGGDEMLTRLSATAWPSVELLSEWRDAVDEADRRDHRRIGQSQHLWALHPSSPGSPYFLPHGERLLSRLRFAVRSLLGPRGYAEVTTPQLFEPDLWRTSGHWQNYREDMYIATGAGKEPAGEEPAGVLGLKPMNCPAHCVVFGVQTRSHRDLPLRVSDFGALHRNEASGALTGLTRVRRFHQDDAHIFCAAVDDGGGGGGSLGLEQVRAEVLDCLGMVRQLYRQSFGMGFSMRLATRPERFLGEEAEWEAAESALRGAMREALQEAEAEEGHGGNLPRVGVEADARGDGAFYGPKIDITAVDALGRQHQCATIQLDFQLAGRFGLQYSAADGSRKTPVIVHRALLGSFERILAVLAEHYAGRWPLWLCPRQITVIPLPGAHAAARRFAEAVAAGSATESAFVLGRPASDDAAASAAASASHTLPLSAEPSAAMVEYDPSSKSLGKRVREAQVAQSGIIAVVGAAEASAGSLALRFRDDGVMAAFARAAVRLCTAVETLQSGGDVGEQPPAAVAEAAQLTAGVTAEQRVALGSCAALRAWAERGLSGSHGAAEGVSVDTNVLLAAATVRLATALRL